MPGAPSYAEAFSPLSGRCFRMVAHHGDAGLTSAPRRWLGAGLGGPRTVAATGSRSTRATGPSRMKVAALPPSLAADAQVQVDPAALPLDLIDLALAVVLAPGLEGQQLGVAGKHLEGREHVSYCHALSVAVSAHSVSP
jgi:hypothetical protein